MQAPSPRRAVASPQAGQAAAPTCAALAYASPPNPGPAAVTQPPGLLSSAPRQQAWSHAKASPSVPKTPPTSTRDMVINSNDQSLSVGRLPTPNPSASTSELVETTSDRQEGGAARIRHPHRLWRSFGAAKRHPALSKARIHLSQLAAAVSKTAASVKGSPNAFGRARLYPRAAGGTQEDAVEDNASRTADNATPSLSSCGNEGTMRSPAGDVSDTCCGSCSTGTPSHRCWAAARAGLGSDTHASDFDGAARVPAGP